jgi:succinoglycan biosynthesis protein ExoV
MKLYYWKSKSGNVGDDLNPWLFERLLPGAFNDSSESVLIGIGTQINDLLLERINAHQIIIFTTGVGYGTRHFVKLPTVNERWHIYGLRGPLSAQALQVSQDYAITDGALLLRHYFDGDQYPKKYKFSFMPHLQQAVESGHQWKSACEQTGFQYIDPRGSVEQVVEAIAQSETLLSEAMHGAIMADTLRVPWIAIQTSSQIFGFKWLDWCQSVGVRYCPEMLPKLPSKSTRKFIFKQGNETQQAIKSLKQIAYNVKPILSKEAQMKSLLERLDEKIDNLREKIELGIY